MGKQGKRLLLLVVILLAAVGSYFGIRTYNDRQEEKKALEEVKKTVAVTEIEADTVTAVSYMLENKQLTFEKKDDTWIYTEDESIDIDENSIELMIEGATALTSERVIENVIDLSEYGIDAPTNIITITTEEKTTTLVVGAQNAITSDYYMTVDNGTSVYTIAASDLSFNKTVEELTHVE